MRPLLRDRRAAFGVAVLAIVAAASVAAPLVTGGRPTAQGDIVATRFLPPLSGDGGGGFHVLGTDRFGRDVWTRLVYGARVSLAVGTLAVLLSIVLGTLWPFGVPVESRALGFEFGNPVSNVPLRDIELRECLFLAATSLAFVGATVGIVERRRPY